MRDLSWALKTLSQLFQLQLEGYKALLAQGREDEQLLKDKQMEKLLANLAERKDQLDQLEKSNQEISEVQDWLCQIYDLETFSVKALGEKIPARHTGIFSDIQEKLAELVEVLEKLEVQERTHERLLQQIAGLLQQSKGTSKSHAIKAYKSQKEKSDNE